MELLQIELPSPLKEELVRTNWREGQKLLNIRGNDSIYNNLRSIKYILNKRKIELNDIFELCGTSDQLTAANSPEYRFFSFCFTSFCLPSTKFLEFRTNSSDFHI